MANRIKWCVRQRPSLGLIKYKIRQIKIKYSKRKVRQRRSRLCRIENELKECQTIFSVIRQKIMLYSWKRWSLNTTHCALNYSSISYRSKWLWRPASINGILKQRCLDLDWKVHERVISFVLRRYIIHEQGLLTWIT